MSDALDIALGLREPHEQALRDALAAVPEDDLWKIESLMYSGRESENVHQVHKQLYKDPHGVTVSVIAGKMPLDEYLENGLALAVRYRVNLEGDF